MEIRYLANCLPLIVSNNTSNELRWFVGNRPLDRSVAYSRKIGEIRKEWKKERRCVCQ